jgi:hypothetical protein
MLMFPTVLVVVVVGRLSNVPESCSSAGEECRSILDSYSLTIL